MRKLILAATVVCVAAVSQAASVNWSADYSYMPGTTDYNEGWLMAYIDNADLSRSEFLALSGNDAIATAISTYGGVGDLTDSEGYSTGYSKSSAYAPSSTVNGYLVLFDAATVESATKMYVSPTLEVTFPGASGLNKDASFGDLTATQTAGNWTAIAVPEPTSGLLMLLGVAGLALRRKRA